MSNKYQQPPPPYPYQEVQQPLQGQHSGDYAPYPQMNQQPQQADQRWGTPVMGTPSKPDAHPDNQQAATGSFGGPNRESSGAFNEQVQAAQTQSAPSVSGQGQGPYVQSSTSTNTSTTPGKGGSMDKIKAQVQEYSTQAQDVMNRVWGHLSTGPSMADTAWGRVTAGTQLIRQGGFEGVFKTTFTAASDEKLKKTYACFLSTSTGPVAGTLYISNKKLAFCSDRPLSYTPENAPNGQQPSYSYYKVIIPVDKVGAVNPSVNQKKPTEKYIQVVTKDDFEFWFMGFVNYEKGVKNLQAMLTPDNQQAGGSAQQTYPPNQQTYPPPPNQQPYPPNQQQQQNYVPPNQYGTPPK